MAAPATPAARSPRTRARVRASAPAYRRGHAPRTTPAPSRPRRVSGPAKRRTIPKGKTRRITLGTVAGRVAALPDARIVDRILRGRAWIGLVGVLLIGLVALQVSMLKLNAGIGASVERSSTLERQNSRLEASIAGLSSADRIRGKARKLGLVAPRIERQRYVWGRVGNAKLAVAAIAGGAYVAKTPGQTGTPGTGSAPADTAGTTAPPDGGTYSQDQIDTMLSDGDPSNDAQAMLNDGDPSNDAQAMLNDGDPSNDDQAIAAGTSDTSSTDVGSTGNGTG